MARQYIKTDTEALLQKAAGRYSGSPEIGAQSLMMFPRHTDASRVTMAVTHFGQFVTLLKTELPKLFTNFEGMVGENSSYVTKAESNYKVIAKITKFSLFEDVSQPYVLIVHDVDTDMYDVLTKVDVENLAEKYGFEYNNEVINSYKDGDLIEKGTVLSRPFSYDNNGVWGFGQNIRFVLQVDDSTIEDALVVSESISSALTSTEVEVVKVSINDNDILLDTYGVDGEYKGFADISDNIKDKILCARRRITNSQILFDLQENNTKQILCTDNPSYIDGQVIDIDIYCNKDIKDIPDSAVNKQLIRHLEMNRDYYEKIKGVIGDIVSKHGMEKCTLELRNLYNRAIDLTDKSVKIRDENDSEFSNIVMYFTVKRRVGATKGQKLTGRHGNKGVIAKVVPDKLMPVTEHGERIDLIINTNGVPNRDNAFQLFELSITHGASYVERAIRETCSLVEKERLYFDFIECFNENQSKMFRQNIYEKYYLTEEEKFQFFENMLSEGGICIHADILDDDIIMYDAIGEMYNRFPFIRLSKTFRWCMESRRYIPLACDQMVGFMYIMKLKQSAKKNHSVVSHSPINQRCVPEKTNSTNEHTSPVAKTPVRSGIQETVNKQIYIDPKIIAEEHLLLRSSSVGRRSVTVECNQNYAGPKEIEITSQMTNKNVEVLNSRLMVLGYELNFDQDYISVEDEGVVTTHMYKGLPYICTTREMKDIVARDIVNDRIANDGISYIGDGQGYEQLVDQLVEEIVEDIEDNI